MSRVISLLMPNLHGGGAERVAVNLANGLVARGYRVNMVLFEAVGDFLHELDPATRVVDLKAPRIRQGFLPLLRHLRTERPAALLACMWPLSVMALWARRLAGVSTRVVVAEHTTWSQSQLLRRRGMAWRVRTSMHWSFPKAHGVVAVSAGAADDLARFARLRRDAVTMIYNPVVDTRDVVSDAVRSPPQPPLRWWEGSHRRVLAVGKLKVVKDYGTLLEAFSLMHRQANAKLLILGEGECRLVLEAKVRQLGLADCVFMPGFVKDTAPYYSRADLHVLSSLSEGLPTVLIEALAAGTPVVSTDCPSGPREILRDGLLGRLVPVGDAVALANAMKETLASEADCAALRRRAEDFSIDAAVARYEALLLPSDSASRGFENA